MSCMTLKLIGVIFIILIAVFGIFYLSNKTTGECSPIHWHPGIKIMINGEERAVPNGIGISIGRAVDTELSGMAMAPSHTHSSDGVIHMENNCPNKKPETYTLGYFFKVWNKTFNSTCIFNYCNNNDKKVGVSINGGENTEFENYSMKDGDQIIITYP